MGLAVCSFCDVPASDDACEVLLSAPREGVFICSKCVALAQLIIDDWRENRNKEEIHDQQIPE